MHVWPVAQRCSHAPQLATSVIVATQAPPQSVVPVAQTEMQEYTPPVPAANGKVIETHSFTYGETAASPPALPRPWD